jgi:peptide/nickel transport system substrate-binding protein
LTASAAALVAGIFIASFAASAPAADAASIVNVVSAVPAGGAILRVVSRGEPDSLNPLLSQQDLSYALDSLIFSHLITADQNGTPIPDLATEIPTLRNGGISADGKTYTYHLRRGVRWHDGAPFSADDVRFSWRAVMNPKNDVFGRQGYGEIVSLDTPDRFTVVAHLRRRYPPFVTEFFTDLQEDAKALVPAHLLRDLSDLNHAAYNAKPIGTGPFRVTEWRRGERIRLTAFPDYWRGRPQLAGIDVSIVPDDATILNLLRAGQADFVANPSPELLQQYRALSGYVTTLSRSNVMEMLLTNDARPGLRDPVVRRALVRAIDVDALTAKVTHGAGERAYDVLPPGTLGYVRNAPVPYDPAGARRSLDAAGWRAGPDGIRQRGGERLSFGLIYPAGSSSERALGVQVQAMLHAIGVGIELKGYAYETIFAYDGPIVTHRYDIATSQNTLQLDPDYSEFLTCAAFRPRGENDDQFCDRTFDAGERAGLSSDDPVVRTSAYATAERRIAELVPFVPLYLLRRITVATARLSGYRPSPTVAPWWDAWRWRLAPEPSS